MTQIPEQLGVDGRLIPKPKLHPPGHSQKGVGRGGEGLCCCNYFSDGTKPTEGMKSISEPGVT